MSASAPTGRQEPALFRRGRARQFVRRAVQSFAPRLALMALGERRWLHEREVVIVGCLADRRSAAFDVGANKGVYTYLMSKAFGEVHAFEPQPELGAYLARAAPRNVKVHRVAVSDQAGEVVLRIPVDPHLNELSAIGLVTDHPVREVAVPRIRLDDVEVSNLALVKIDVEGHELAVIRGAGETLARHRPTVIVEAEERHAVGTVGRIADALGVHGYEGFFLDGRRLASLATFDRSVHQDTTNLRDDGKRIGQYTNNFVFIHKDRLVVDLARIGYGTSPAESRAPV